jgi:intracellular septation protein
MGILFDFLPLFAFFIAFKFWGIYVATGVAMVLSVLQISFFVVQKRTVPVTLYINGGIIVVLGAATLFLHNEWFIKWKPTVLYLLFASILFVGQKFYNKNFIKMLSGAGAEQLALPDILWRKLNYAWAGFFLIVSILNIVVAYHFETAVWVNFKVFGILGLLVFFVVAQGVYLTRYGIGSGKVE